MLASIACLLAAGCSQPTKSLSLSGRVVDETRTLAVPPLSASRTASTTVTVARVREVSVELGDPVQRGEVVARLDDTALRADVASAEAALRLASARIGVIGARIDDIDETRSTLRDRRDAVMASIAEITAQRAALAARLEDTRTRLAQLRALRDRLSALPPSAPLPPGTPSSDELAASIERLTAAVRQMEAGIARMDAGLAKAREGLAELDSARSTSAEARRSLGDLRRVARTGSEVARVAVTLARELLERTEFRSPADGTVVWVAQQGEVLATGSPVVVIRPTLAASVDSWVTPQQREAVEQGAAAYVRLDSRPGAVYPARVTSIGVRAMYPPTWFSTSETHMTRAYPLTVECTDPDVWLPAGTPVDIEIRP